MLNNALQAIFWGYLFIFFRIQIGIDWLADPIGYLLIASACSKLSIAHPHAKKAGTVAGIGVFFSIPSVFVNLSELQIGLWETYSLLLLVLKVIVAYYLFAVLKSIVNNFNDQALIIRTHNVFTFHIAAHLTVLALNSFSMNVSGDFWVVLSVALSILLIVMDIAFLLLIGAIRRNEPQHKIDYSI